MRLSMVLMLRKPKLSRWRLLSVRMGSLILKKVKVTVRMGHNIKKRGRGWGGLGILGQRSGRGVVWGRGIGLGMGNVRWEDIEMEEVIKIGYGRVLLTLSARKHWQKFKIFFSIFASQKRRKFFCSTFAKVSRKWRMLSILFYRKHRQNSEDYKIWGSFATQIFRYNSLESACKCFFCRCLPV